MQIKQNTATINLVFFMADETDHVTGITGLSPSVNLSKNGGSFASAAGAVTEIGNGFYKVAANATDSNTLGVLALNAASAGADQATMAFEIVANIESDSVSAIAALNNLSAGGVRTELATELGRIDAAISTRNATTPPTVSAIADAVWDEAMAGHATAGTAGAQLTAAGASGDPWASVVPAAYADGTAGAAIGRLNNTPAEAPVIVVPAPDEDDSLTVCYLYTESITNAKSAGIKATVKLVSTPAKSERLLEVAEQTMTTDANGYMQITLQAGHRYKFTSRDLGFPTGKAFTATGETLNLLTVLIP